jgi:subfamily B ATP-binding cassette protein MsbA
VTAALRARRVKSLLSPVVTIVVSFCTAFVLWRGTSLILTGVMTVGALTVFLAYLSKFFKPVQDLAKMTNTIAQDRRRPRAHPVDPVGGRRDPGKVRRHRAGAVQGQHRLRARGVRLRQGQPGASRRQLFDQARADHRRGRRHRQRKIDDREPHSALLRSDRRARADRWRRRARLPAATRLRKQIGFVLQETVLFHGTIRDKHRVWPSRHLHGG